MEISDWKNLTECKISCLFLLANISTCTRAILNDRMLGRPEGCHLCRRSPRATSRRRRYWNVLSHCIYCTGIFLRVRYFVLEYPYWLHILYWTNSTGGLFCTGISLLAAQFVLAYFYWHAILYWNISIDGLFCTRISLLAAQFVQKYFDWRAILY